tara:strand:+ start:15801 stop:17078 length:1278 start_codon:yes stop_codon:yes gene_type:complete
MFLTENLQQKWGPVLEHPDLPVIKDSYKKAVTTVILENQEKAMKEERGMLHEAAPVNDAAAMPDSGGIAKFDPILISLVRRAMPNLIAYDICGVQPMTGPTGLIFAMKSRYATQGGTEALFTEADTDFSGKGTHANSNPVESPFTTGTGGTTAEGEALGDGSVSFGNSGHFQEMAFSIEKTSVTAVTRALKAEYTLELAQDLKAVHGLDAETELANILSAEILAEINREVVRLVYTSAKPGAQAGAVASAGTFDLDTDSNGRWSVERFKGLLFQIERDANTIAQDTRRGKGNFIITSSDVASALSMAGVLDYTPALQSNLTVDDTGNTFAGTINGGMKVYIDPYSANSSDSNQFYCVGYKGSNAYDAGLFYCPYVPLQMVRAVGESTFQPKIGFKTRYGLVSNPFTSISANSNAYYRLTAVTNLM